MTYAHAGLAVQRAAEIVGSQAALARAIGVASPTVNQFVKKVRPVPEKVAVAIESATSGEVHRRDLRPDDWHLIWPELAQQAQSNAPASPSTQKVSHG
ncbi:helix-turn-helix domain-containing protein [Comamonas aquatica]|nr:helix-turn-helix domain-containing protein [Comamonas aquatica]